MTGFGILAAIFFKIWMIFALPASVSLRSILNPTEGPVEVAVG
jgi:hypothetical protein